MSVRFSYSRLEQYNNCPYAYNLKYNEGHYISTDSVAAPFGSLCHKIIEQTCAMIKNGRPINYESLKRDFIEMNIPKRNKYDRTGDLFGTKILEQRYQKEWHDSFTPKGHKSYEMRAKEFLETGIYMFPKYCEEHPELEIVGAEIGFEFEYRGYVFMGFIDRVMKVKGKDSYIIFDIKTKDSPFPDKELVTPLQHVIYCRALRGMYGEDIEINCYYELPFVDGGIWQHAGTKGFESRGMKKIDKLLDGIEAGDWHSSPSKLCWWCPFRKKENTPLENCLCPYYSLYNGETKAECYEVKNQWRGMEHHEEVMQNFKEQCILESGGKLRGDDWDIEF